MRKQHVLFISSWYPNRNDPTHGIFNRYFAEAASLHVKVSVLHVCSDPALQSDSETTESDDGSIYTLIIYYKKISGDIPFISQLRKKKSVWQCYDTGFKKIVDRNGAVDLIHLNVIWPAGISVLKLSRKYRLPYVANECWTGYSPEDGRYRGFIMKYYTRRVAAHAAALLPVTEYLKERMMSYGLNGSYHIVPNVVNVDRFRPAGDSVSGVTSLLHISTLDDEQKNVSGLIRAFCNAAKEVPQLELSIVGDGPSRGQFEKLAESLNCRNIKFKGRLLGEDLVNEMQQCDATLMFSNYETFCLVIVEGFACGKPAITSNAGGIASYMEPGLGIMVPMKDEPALTRAIISFAQQKTAFDPQYLRSFAVNNFSSEAVGEKLSHIYRTYARKSAS